MNLNQWTHIGADVGGGGLVPARRKKDNPGCGGSSSKFTDSAGRIRKVNWKSDGEGGFEESWEHYYRENGKLLFVFTNATAFTGESGIEVKVTEHRVWFDDANKVMFEVLREGEKGELAELPHRAPKPDEKWQVAPFETNAEENFKTDGCRNGD